MLDKLRNFSKSKLAGVLIVIIIIPFVFWGMGSVFSGGNTNSLVKINNKNISTQDFIDFVNTSNLDPNAIKKNIDKNIIEEILTQLISLNLLNLEIENLEVTLSDQSLFDRIVNDKKFFDENNKFSRIKYEKFLLENNTSAIAFEQKIRDSELQKDLFAFVNGGMRSPNFLVQNLFLDETKEIQVEYLNLETFYKKKEFTNEEMIKYIEENKSGLSKDIIDISYAKLTPLNLVNSEQFNNEFFSKIDDIDNDISNNIDLNLISTKYNFDLTNIKNYIKNEKDDEYKILNEIYNKRNENKFQIIDKENYYLIYEIKDIKRLNPNLNDKVFYDEVNKKLRSKYKFNFNKEILKEIELGKFNNKQFKDLETEDNKIEKLNIISKNDNSFFDVDSLNLLYTIPENDFLLIIDNDKNVYLTKVVKFNYKTIYKNSEDFEKFFIRSNFKLKNDISLTYDDLLGEKYKVVINENTLERVKNFFR